MMMPATCHNLEFGRIKFAEFGACGCVFNSSFDRFRVRNYARKVFRSVNKGYSGGYGRKLICCRSDDKVTKCRVFSTEAAPKTLLNGYAPGPPSVLSVKEASKANLFEVVSDDLLTLNKNLQSDFGNSSNNSFLVLGQQTKGY